MISDRNRCLARQAVGLKGTEGYGADSCKTQKHWQLGGVVTLKKNK
jgi:hypothetical protein